VTAEVLGSLLKEVLQSGYKKIHVILDQLNTHWSVTMVATIATLCNLPIPSENDMKTGKQRKDWLSYTHKAIVFHSIFKFFIESLFRKGSHCGDRKMQLVGNQVFMYLVFIPRIKSLKIEFHYTPKHASWLNPIERWFGILVKKLLRYGFFRSKKDLAQQLAEFIEYYNTNFAHPYKFKCWKEVA
jgi:hypothetical protein